MKLASIMEEMLMKISPRVAVKLGCHFLKNDKLSPRDAMYPLSETISHVRSQGTRRCPMHGLRALLAVEKRKIQSTKT